MDVRNAASLGPPSCSYAAFFHAHACTINASVTLASRPRRQQLASIGIRQEMETS